MGDEWSGITDSTTEVINNELAVNVVLNGATAAYATQVYQEGFEVNNGFVYTIEFDAYANDPRPINVQLGDALNYDPWFTEFMDPYRIDLTTTKTHYSIEFTMTNQSTPDQGKLVFELGPMYDTAIDTTVFIDNVSITATGQNTEVIEETIDYDSLVYELVWSDEFNYEGAPNPDYWTYDIGGSGWGNNELQYYTEDNVIVTEGNLVIEARKELLGGKQYTSTRLVSKNEGSFQYGIVEVRAKLPYGRGTWPAIWMLPTNWMYGGWPDSGEIDIMEHVGYDMNVVHGTVHTGSYNHMIGTQRGGSIDITDVVNDYHVYKIEWLPDKIDFYVDDIHYFTFSVEGEDNVTSSEWPFDQAFHLIFNIAVGGSWGGVEGVDDSIFPQSMYIDYVRVYQSETIQNTIN